MRLGRRLSWAIGVSLTVLGGCGLQKEAVSDHRSSVATAPTQASGASPVAGADATAAACHAAALADPTPADPAAASLLANCAACHTGAAAPAGIAIDAMLAPGAPPAADAWNKVAAAITSGVMPPGGFSGDQQAAAKFAGAMAAGTAHVPAPASASSSAQPARCPSAPTPASPSPAAAMAPASACDGTGALPHARRVWRLTHTQYKNAVADLLGLTRAAVDGVLPADDGYDVSDLSVGDDLVELYAKAAGAVAQMTTLAKLQSLASCDLTAVDCAHGFVLALAKRAYRQPLLSPAADAGAPDQAAFLAGLYDVGASGGGTLAGLQAAIQGILQSPLFLYRKELGTPDPAQPGIFKLSSYEVAEEAGFLVWGSLPPADLWTAADSDGADMRTFLASYADLLAEGAQPAGGKAAVSAFYANMIFQTYGLVDAALLSKNPADYPLFPKLAPTLDLQARTFIDAVLWQGNGGAGAGSFGLLMAAPYTFSNGDLAKTLGLPAVAGSALKEAPVDPSRAGGLLTLPLTMAVYGASDRTSPVARGKFVREQVLCEAIPPPPPNIDQSLTSPSPHATKKQVYAAHRQNPTCAACHKFLDGVGFAFEAFGADGGDRATDELGEAVDTTGSLVRQDGSVTTFADAGELARILAKAPEAKSCFATQFYAYSFGGRVPGGPGACGQAKLGQTFTQGDDIRSLLKLLLTSDEFFERSASTDSH